jgi:hypothetical protein
MLLENARNDVRDIVELHDLTVDDRVRLQVLKTKVQQVKAVALPLQLNRFDRASTNVQSYEALFDLFEHKLFIPHHGERPHSVLST